MRVSHGVSHRECVEGLHGALAPVGCEDAPQLSIASIFGAWIFIVADKVSNGGARSIRAYITHSALISVAARKVVRGVCASAIDGAAIGRARVSIVAIQ